jgi:predicted Zn-dependent peptidase
MKLIIIMVSLMVLGIFAAPGDFVRDIPIKELKFEIPKINKEDLGQGISYYYDDKGEFPIVNLDIHIYGGESTLQGLPIEVSSLLADTLKYGGSKDLPEEALVSRLEALGATLSIQSDYEKFIISLSYLTRDQDEVLNLIGDLLSNPSFSDSAFENSKRKLNEAIKRRNERTESVGFRKIREILFQGTKKSIPPQEDSVKSISTEQLKLHFDDLMKNRKKSIVVSGKFDEASLRDWIVNHLGIDTEKSTQNLDDISLEFLKEKFTKDNRNQIFIEKDVNQSMLIYAGLLPPHNSKDFFAVQVLNYIIGGGGFNSYMMQKIREEKGLAYSAASVPRFAKNYGVIYFYTLTKNESLKEADQILQSILSEQTIQKITEKQVQDAKNAIVNQFVFLFANRHSVLNNQLNFDEDDMPKDYLNIYRDKIYEVSIDDIRRVGKEYFYSTKLKSLIVSSKSNIEKFKEGEKLIYQPEDSIFLKEK